MFTKKVTDDDNFMNLSSSAQALYLHLSMAADDDGFCNQVSASMFKAHASIQDLEALLEKRYIYQFDNGVIVIKHWRMANALRKDRYTPTAFKEELAQLKLKENGSYTMASNDGCRLVANCLPQDRLDKVRVEKNRIDKDNTLSNDSVGEKRKRFVPPTIEEIEAYGNESKYKIDAERFIAHYSSNGWMVGKNKMKDWKAAVRNWWLRDNESKSPKKQPERSFNPTEF